MSRKVGWLYNETSMDILADVYAAICDRKGQVTSAHVSVNTDFSGAYYIMYTS